VSRSKVVIIEDEPDIVEVISYNLKREGYQVVSSGRGDEGLDLARAQSPALVILDLMLPGMDGLTVCQRLKADPMTRDIPIIIVSAKGEESDVVIGLGLGADDYLAKPFSPRELLARARAVLRRGPIREDSQERIVIRDLVIDMARHEVRIGGELVRLTTTELKILHQLASRPRRAFTREQLLNRVVGEGAVIVDRNIDVHIRAVRKKLGDYARMIQTIRGVGYRFVDD
jgi:two-component system alkaline phosphatase synthesis response regulator PhoP